jgi:hypothetical protein
MAISRDKIQGDMMCIFGCAQPLQTIGAAEAGDELRVPVLWSTSAAVGNDLRGTNGDTKFILAAKMAIPSSGGAGQDEHQVPSIPPSQTLLF